MSNLNVKICVCYHKASPVFKNDCFLPIWVGKRISNEPAWSDEVVGDDTMDNISHKNKSYCEFTAFYWMWKNLDADYYGLFHYRRFLNFNYPKVTDFRFYEFNEETIQKYGWNEENVKAFCSQYDIITSPSIPSFHPHLPGYKMTSYEQYALGHNSKDMNIVMEIIKEKYPEMHQFCWRWLHSRDIFFCNLLIMKKEYFHQYCEWIFDILFEAEKRIDISGYNDYQKRALAFLGGRLSNCFVAYLREKHPELKYRQLEGAILVE